MIACPKCGAQLNDNSVFCMSCGTPISVKYKCSNCGGEVNPNDQTCRNCGATFLPEGQSAGKQKGKSKFPVKIIAIVAALAAVVAAVIIILNVLPKGKAKDAAVYIKDKEVMFSDLSRSQEVTTKFYNTAGENSDYYGSSYYGYFWLTEDGKTLFFPDKVQSFSEYALYYCDTKNPQDTATKIDGGVYYDYNVNKDATLVTFVNKGGTLYQYDMKAGEKTKIDTNVVTSGWHVSDDGKIVVYVTNDNGSYTIKKYSNGEKEKIASDASDIQFVSKDGKKVYYTKEGSLYLKEDGNEEKQKIAKDVYGVAAVYDGGEIYYITSEEVKDEKTGYTANVYMLYYYNGKEEEMISESYYSYMAIATEKPVIIYGEIEDNETSWFIAAENRVQALSLSDDMGRATISKDGKVAFYIDYDSSSTDYAGELYRIEISGKDIGKAEKYDEDVYTSYIYIVNNDTVAYFKDYKNNEGELFVNKSSVESDVMSYNYDPDTGKIYYVTDYNSEKGYGDLSMYYKGDKTKISTDVYNTRLTPEGNALYLKDVSHYKGELYYFNGSKSEKIDEDVLTIIVPVRK